MKYNVVEVVAGTIHIFARKKESSGFGCEATSVWTCVSRVPSSRYQYSAWRYWHGVKILWGEDKVEYYNVLWYLCWCRIPLIRTRCQWEHWRHVKGEHGGIAWGIGPFTLFLRILHIRANFPPSVLFAMVPSTAEGDAWSHITSVRMYENALPAHVRLSCN